MPIDVSPTDGETPEQGPLDQLLWPLQLALASWAALLAGIVCATGGFDEPRPWQNVWVRLAAIAVTLFIAWWGARAIRSGQGRRRKLALVASLIAHTLLVAVLYRQSLSVSLEALAPVEKRRSEPPVEVIPASQYELEFQAESARSDPFNEPVATQSLAVRPLVVGRTDLPLPRFREVSTEMAAAVEVLRSDLPNEPRRRPQDETRDRPHETTEMGVRSPHAPISPLPADDRLDGDMIAEWLAAASRREPVDRRPADLRPARPLISSQTVRPPASRIAPVPVPTLPELPASVATQDAPRQRAADRLTPIALDRSRTLSRHRVVAAPLPEMPSETLEPAEQTLTHSTRMAEQEPTQVAGRPSASRQPDSSAAPVGAVPTRLARSELASDGLARAMTSASLAPPSPLGTPKTTNSGRPSAVTLRRRRSADAEPGMQSGGGMDRPERSSGPTPAALVASPTTEVAEGALSDLEMGAEHVPPGAGALEESASDAESPARTIVASRPADSGLGTPQVPFDGTGPALSPGGGPRMPTEAFAGRGQRQKQSHTVVGNGIQRPSATTEAAIELGLEFLAGCQLDDGRWSFDPAGAGLDTASTGTSGVRADAAATGLALMAFFGAGYDHVEGKYRQVVRKGIEYLIREQRPSGEIFPEQGRAASQVTRFYSHGIATLALAEAFGMSRDELLRRPCQAAVDYLSRTQHPQLGGWRYAQGVNADLSVTGWQLMALRSSELAGLQVPPSTFVHIRRCLEQCREEGGSQARFRYNPWASPGDPTTRHGRQPSTVMTAVGLLAELHLGTDVSDRRWRLGVDHLLTNSPVVPGSNGAMAPIGTLGNPQRDTYYWYYATQVMFHRGGPHWQAWNERLHPLLVDSQIMDGPRAGSWDPQHPTPDRWASYGGRVYVTAMNLLSLEVYYRHLPFQSPTSRMAEGRR